MSFTDLPQFILACPMCMSGAEGKTILAANSAIATLLVVLCGVLMSFLSFIIYLAKRSRRYANDVPGESGIQEK